MTTTTLKLTGIRGLQTKVRLLADPPFNKMALGDIGMFSMHSIKKRTLEGEDFHGVSFKSYSKKYAKEREKRGFPVKPVDLSRTGSMLSAMTYDADRNKVDIFFMNTQGGRGPGYPNTARNPAKAFFLNEDREFFALSESEVKKIVDIVEGYYNKLLRSR